jgi:RNA polymerase sigma-70 factor (ECF subfamily)
MSKNKLLKNNVEKGNPKSELIIKICEGDADAFKNLFETYCQALIYFAWRYVKNTQVAENIVQDVFLRIWLNRTKLNPALNTKSYLYKAVKNQALQHLRKAKIENQKGNFQVLDDSTKSPEDILEEQEISVAVQRAISELPTQSRLIFTMSKYSNLKYSEIAEIQNISIKTVETHMGRALKFLRKRLANLRSDLLK